MRPARPALPGAAALHTLRAVIPRQPQHDNEWVRATDDALLRVCERWGARVGFKQRIADVLRVERNNSSFEEGRYALLSHFDFVVWRDGTPQFAVEFDEGHHRSDPAQQRRDAMKDRLCWQAGFPLVRAVDRSLKRLGGWVLIEWLIELWFVHRDVVDRDRREADLRRLSEVPDSWHAEDLTDGQVLWMTEFSTPSKMDYTRMFAPRPGRADVLDPFSDARERLHVLALEGRRVQAYWERPPTRSGWVRGSVLVEVGRDEVLMGEGECFAAGPFFIGDGLLPMQIAQDLATQQAVVFLDLHDRGRITAMSSALAQEKVAGMLPGALNHVRLGAKKRLSALLTLAQRAGIEVSVEQQRDAIDAFIKEDAEFDGWTRAVEAEAQDDAWRGARPEPPV
jgi:hypothetical protein